MSLEAFSRKKRSWGLLTLIGLIALAIYFVGVSRSKTDPDLLLLYGNADIREVQLAFRQPGRILQMTFDEGDTVKAGDRMATLNAEPYREALAAAEAQVLVAEAQLAKLRQGLRPQEITQLRETLKKAQAVEADADINFERQNRLITTGATSQKAFDAAKAASDQAKASVGATKAALSQALEGSRREDLAAAEAQLAAAQAAAAAAKTALDDTELTAPSDGTVIARVREPGSMVNSQSTVYSLSLNKPVYIRAYIGEKDLGRIAPGTAVEIRTDSSSKVYKGKIGFISPRAEFTPKTVETADLRTDLVYRLRIVVADTDADQSLRQGMPVTIEIDTRRNSQNPDGV